MIRAVLFDLDGTLLDIEIDSFLSSYFAALGPVLASVTGLPARTALGALNQATNAMLESHPGQTNRDIFNRSFATLTGTDLSESKNARVVEEFYGIRFASLRDTNGPREGALAAVSAARAAGMRTALATNPIFPRVAIIERLKWVGGDESAFDHVTSYETSVACKPLPEYFLGIAAALDTDPRECLMVGDDATLDMGASGVDMQTFYVGRDAEATADWKGSLNDLSDLLVSLVQ